MVDRVRIFYDPARDALFVGTMRAVFPARTLEANATGDRISVWLANDPAAVIFSDHYSAVMRHDGEANPWADVNDCLAYLREEFARYRRVAFEFVQEEPRDVWIIEHNLGFRPGVVVTANTTGQQLLAPASYPDLNTVRVEFGLPTSGTAHLS